jgi:hypothetical protein
MSESIPRLSEVEMPPELLEMLRPRIRRLGYLGEFFKCAAHQPQALTSFIRFTNDLKEALPDNLTEVVALSVAAIMKNDYERVQHERLCLKLGFSEPWIRQVLSLQPDENGPVTEAERLVQRLVSAGISKHGHETEVELEEVVRAIGAPQAIAVLMLAGRYMTHSLIVNCLSLAPPVASPLLKE